ncbi:anaphase-promoting complex subunit 15-like isoform X1 [Cloeon dipterum]|uniref:anaphase-promoting complex subunit 15-like isoform X1 n=1 Tax=Cloeon dipterum TaxID=197152 RepID=UPI003220484C
MDLFPIKLSLKPRLVDPLWFSVDKPCDEEAEIFAMEQELSTTLESIANKDSDAPVFGKSNSEQMEEIEEDEEEEEEEDNDSDSRGEDEEEEDLDLDHDHMDLTYEHADSPEET